VHGHLLLVVEVAEEALELAEALVVQRLERGRYQPKPTARDRRLDVLFGDVQIGSYGGVMKYLLWSLQALLAALFLFSGVSKFTPSVAEMAAQAQLSVGFIQFIGVCEALGGLGLILPGLLRIRTGLTPLAAVGLEIIMVGAVITTANAHGIGPAVFPAVVGVLLAFVAYGRWRLLPLARQMTSTKPAQRDATMAAWDS
jgi:uncharacterized membrane protein YphA (DoxX/SURF4 family)